ncbi:MAG: hypothetical protein CMJ76_09830 [Planctomycetaceae bacterium]|nr:hypothetical protein [Planctomycetaceae bacterium]|tara:strand:- start:1762 stop:2373 length:612 start_codon:yes stop_codon:yes gene_type:complete
MAIKGIIFDMDGTLIDSRLDFDQMRHDMDLPIEAPILETIESYTGLRRQQCNEVLRVHEQIGVEKATVFPGVSELLEYAQSLDLKMAIVTRNLHEFAVEMLRMLPVTFSPVIGREEGPIKPDPWALCHICENWGLETHQVVMAGDYRFDLEAGKRAGCPTLWFSQKRVIGNSDWHQMADYILEDNFQGAELLDRIIEDHRDSS